MDSTAAQEVFESGLTELQQYHPGTLILTKKIGDFCHKLYPSEQQFISKAIGSRRREFSTGRWLAHTGLSRFGVSHEAILPGDQRQPLWPDGIVGSISHTKDHAVVALARERDYRAIGIDTEKKRRVEPALAFRILTQREISQTTATDPTLVFSAKEALHKLVFPLVGHYLEFTDVEIEFDHSTGAFFPRFRKNSSYAGDLGELSGNYVSFRDHWVACVSLR